MGKQVNNRASPNLYARLATIGIQLVVNVFIFVMLGRWADDYFETEKPWFTLGLALFGGFTSILYLSLRFLKGNKK